MPTELRNRVIAHGAGPLEPHPVSTEMSYLQPDLPNDVAVESAGQLRDGGD